MLEVKVKIIIQLFHCQMIIRINHYTNKFNNLRSAGQREVQAQAIFNPLLYS